MKKKVNIGNVLILTILCGTILYLILVGSVKQPDTILKCLAESSVVYQHEPEGQDYWQTVAETEALGRGDCEDMALMLAYKLEKAGFSPKICVGFQNILDPEAKELHMWVEMIIEGKQYILDPTGNLMFQKRDPFMYVELSPVLFQQKLKEWRFKNEWFINGN